MLSEDGKAAGLSRAEGEGEDRHLGGNGNPAGVRS